MSQEPIEPSQKLRKIKLVVSDFHLGMGKYLPDGNFNYLEDFHFDDPFIEFLDYHGRDEFHEVELIINGDFFNHLQTDPHDSHPEIIDENAAVERTRQIIAGHPAVFRALRRFASKPGYSITFILGNHDPGLLFVAVHHLLRETLGERVKVEWGPYVFDGVHVEHGNQYFADNAYNPTRYFLTRRLPEPIVNLPWGSYFVIYYLNKVKKERAYFDKIYPFRYYMRWALIHDTGFALRSIYKIVSHFLSLRFRRDPHRFSPILKTLRIIKEVTLMPNLVQIAKKILSENDDLKIVVFGHSHYAQIRQVAPEKTYINTGLWNEQISLEISNPGKIIRLTYAHLEYEDSRIRASLKEWKGTYKIIEDVY